MHRIILVWVLLPVLLLPACREQSKEELVRQGLTFVEADKSQAAVNLFRQALEKDPNYIDARLQLGLAYLNTNKLDKAESELQKVFRQKPQDPEVALRLAELYLNTDRPEQAMAHLKDFPKTNVNYPEALHFLARAYAMQGDFGSAEELFHASLRARPGHVKTQLGLARLLYGTGRFEAGTQRINEVIADHPQETDAYYLLLRKSLRDRNRPEAIRLLEQIRAVNPEDVYAAYLLGMLYLDAGSTDSAQAIADELLTSRPGHPAGYRIMGVAQYQAGNTDGAVQNLQKSMTGMQDMAGFYFLGLAHYRQGQYELAISSFQKALDEVPEHNLARLMIAQTFLKQGRIEDGIRQVKVVIAQNPTNANAHNVLGSAYMLQGKYDLAMQQIETAIQLDPDLAQAHLHKGLFNLATGQQGQGEIDLARALDAAPEILNTRLLLATHYLRMHNYPEAIALLKEGLAISADNAVIYNFLAAAQFGQNQPQDAVQSLQKAKSLQPEFFAPYFNLAKFYASRKAYEAALVEYQGVLQVAPRNLKALLQAAALQEFLGRNEQAETYYQRAVETQSPAGYLALAGFQKRTNRGQDSLSTLEAGCQAFPEDPELLIAYGEGLRTAGRHEEAIEVFVTLDEARPGLGKPYLLAIHLGRKDLSAAREIAARAIAENRESASGYIFQATIHEALAEWSQAEQVLQEGLAATHDDPSLQMYLAGFYSKRGAYDEALDIYQSLLQDKPDWPPALFGKAAAFDASGNKKQAQDLYEHVLTIDEDYVPALNNLAYLFLEVYADYPRAFELAARGFRLKPNDPRIIDTLGYALLKNGQAEKSILFLEKAARLLPRETAIQLHLAEAYKAAGRTEDAVASLVAIKGMQMPDSQRQKAQTLLEGLN